MSLQKPCLYSSKEAGYVKYSEVGFVIDYKKLNDITVEDRFPIPNIDDIFGKLV